MIACFDFPDMKAEAHPQVDRQTLPFSAWHFSVQVPRTWVRCNDPALYILSKMLDPDSWVFYPLLKNSRVPCIVPKEPASAHVYKWERLSDASKGQARKRPIWLASTMTMSFCNGQSKMTATGKQFLINDPLILFYTRQAPVLEASYLSTCKSCSQFKKQPGHRSHLLYCGLIMVDISMYFDVNQSSFVAVDHPS